MEHTAVIYGETLFAVVGDVATVDHVLAQHPAFRQAGYVRKDGQSVVVVDVAGEVVNKAVFSGES